MNTVEAIKEMLRIWTVIETKAKLEFPNADKETLHKICNEAFLKGVQK